MMPQPGTVAEKTKRSIKEERNNVEVKESFPKFKIKKEEPVRLTEKKEKKEEMIIKENFKLAPIKEVYRVETIKEVLESPSEEVKPKITVMQDKIDFDKMKQLDEIKKKQEVKAEALSSPLSVAKKKAFSARIDNRPKTARVGVKNFENNRPMTAINPENKVININFNFYGYEENQMLPQVKKTLIYLNENFFKDKIEKKDNKPDIKDLVRNRPASSRLCFKNIIKSNSMDTRKISIKDFKG